MVTCVSLPCMWRLSLPAPGLDPLATPAQSHKRFLRPLGTLRVDPGPGASGGAGMRVGWCEGLRKRPGAFWSPGQSSNPGPRLSSGASTPCLGMVPGPLRAPSRLPPEGGRAFLALVSLGCAQACAHQLPHDTLGTQAVATFPSSRSLGIGGHVYRGPFPDGILSGCF